MDRTGSDATVRALVLSQHEAVRRQLVSHLDRSPGLSVSGGTWDPDAVGNARPDVVILDLSGIDGPEIQQVVRLGARVGAHIIALASVWNAEQERIVVVAGGQYHLKRVGADGLAEMVLAARRLRQASCG